MGLDIPILIYSLWGAVVGRRKELSLMIYRLFRTLVAITCGMGLFKTIGRLISKLLGGFFLADSLGFVISVFASLLILRALKKVIQTGVDRQIGPDPARIWGAAAGFFINLIVSGALIITVYLSHAGRLQSLLLRHSVLLRALSDLF